MATQYIPSATVSDVETALIEQYGRTNITEVTKGDTSAEWKFRITNKSQGKCRALKDGDGVNLTMSPRTHMVMWIITVIGYMFLVFPGIFLTLFILIARFITARVINYRFPKMIDNVVRVASARLGNSPVRPT